MPRRSTTLASAPGWKTINLLKYVYIAQFTHPQALQSPFTLNLLVIQPFPPSSSTPSLISCCYKFSIIIWVLSPATGCRLKGLMKNWILMGEYMPLGYTKGRRQKKWYFWVVGAVGGGFEARPQLSAKKVPVFIFASSRCKSFQNV